MFGGAQGRSGATALISAAQSGETKIAKLLIRAGASIDVKARVGGGGGQRTARSEGAPVDSREKALAWGHAGATLRERGQSAGRLPSELRQAVS